MNFKFIGSIVLAICAGFIFAQSVLFVGQGTTKIASNAFNIVGSINLDSYNVANLKNLKTEINEKADRFFKMAYNQLDNIANAASISRKFTIENNSNPESAEQGGDFSAPKIHSPVFVNPASKLIEDFPTNNPDSVNQHKYSENLTIPNVGKVIVANLETMEVDLYEDGEILKSFDILSKGRPGTAWETPPGTFEVMFKTENHFSSIGEVWLPYSMQFFGNYFIHGWPHDIDGTPVPQGYSGGCIRLDDKDAKKVYEFSNLNTAVIVLGTTQKTISNKQTGYYTINNSDNFPDITSQSYIVADIESGDILFTKDAEKSFSIASITKLMTALISLETINQYRYTNVSQRAYDTDGWRGNLSAGERILTGDLIYPLLLQSSNDAAEVLAEFSGRNHFINNMNIRATSLGLENTNFHDPSGLSAKNVSSASDLLKLTHYIYRYKNFIFETSRLESYSNDDHDWPNIHRMTGMDIFLGGKNGFTDEARHTLITLVDLPVDLDGNLKITDEGETDSDKIKNKTNRRFAIILLKAEKTIDDTRKIVNFMGNNIKYIQE